MCVGKKGFFPLGQTFQTPNQLKVNLPQCLTPDGVDDSEIERN